MSALTSPRPSPYPQGQTGTGLIITVNTLVWEVAGHIRRPTQRECQKSYCLAPLLSEPLEGPLWGFAGSWAPSGVLSGPGLCKSLGRPAPPPPPAHTHTLPSLAGP